MKDDSLNDTHITRPGGYCPKCDTVYDRPHECVGKPKYHPVSVLDTRMDTSNKNLGDTKKGYAVARDSVYVKEIWNEAIEAAALKADVGYGRLADVIRRLKK